MQSGRQVFHPPNEAVTIRHITAPNPSPMTQKGTNSYLLGKGDVAVIDPGPLDAAHLDALQKALGPDERIVAILVTHAHLDHSEGAYALGRATGAPVYGFGAYDSGRSPLMQRLADEGHLGGGEGVDHAFSPDIILGDREVIPLGAQKITAHHTPGHFSSHLSFEYGDSVFSGDVVMGWTTTVISPPDGEVSGYMASLDRLEQLGARRFLPGHGAEVTDPAKRITQLRAHRLARETEILRTLTINPASAISLAQQIYGVLPPRLMQAAARNCLAHLIDLMDKDQLTADRPVSDQTIFRLR